MMGTAAGLSLVLLARHTAAAAAAPPAAFRFSTALGDDMVLQSVRLDIPLSTFLSSPAVTTRYRPDSEVCHADAQAPLQAVVWGICAPGSSVKVTFMGKSIDATIGEDLNQTTWMAKLPATPASFDPVNITASSGGSTVTLANVLFGDVWVCSGQSNMQMPIGTPTCWNASNEDCKCTSCHDAQCGYGCVKNAGEEIADMANYPHIRLHNNENGGSAVPLLESQNSGWRTPEKMGGSFSATCWFFGRDLYKSLSPARPLGLIETNVGGTPDQHWSSPDALEKCKNLPGNPKWQWPSNFSDSVLWNGKVVPYLKTTILGAIWYQGEANAGADGRQYNCSFQAMIEDWREKWGAGTDGATSPTFPFGWAQLNSVGGAAVFKGTVPLVGGDSTDPLGQWNPAGAAGYASLRNAQSHTLALPKTFQAVILDTPCSSGSVHSPYKQPVGARLARQALVVQYGGTQPSPVAEKVSASGNTITVTVTGLDTGATLEALPTSSKDGFEVLGSDQQWHATPVASIGAQTVTLSGAPSGAKAVRYLWRSTPCGPLTFGCPVYAKATALGSLTGEHDYLPLAPFTMAL